MTEIIYVLPDLDKIIQDGKEKWCIDYLTNENDNGNEVKFELFDDKDMAWKRYYELLELSLVKNF
jgi:hypothetical protein